MQVDWGVVIVAAIAALPAIIASIASFAALHESKKTTAEVVKTTDEVAKTKEAVATTHAAVNGKMDKLIKLTAAVNYAEGAAAGSEGGKVSPKMRDVLKVAEAAEIESLAKTKADAEVKDKGEAKVDAVIDKADAVVDKIDAKVDQKLG